MNNKIKYLSYVFIYLFYFFALGILSTIMSIYLSDEGKTAIEISIIISSGGVFSLFIQPILGYFIDKTQRTIFLISLFLIVAGILALSLPVTKETAALCILYGLIFALINAVAPINEKLATNSKFKYGYIRIWGAIGFSLASQTSTVIYKYTNDNFIFYILSLSILFTLFGYIYLSRDEFNYENTRNKKEVSSLTAKKVLSRLAFNRMFILFLIINLFFTGMTTVSNVYLPIFLNDNGINLSIIGTIILIATLLEIPLILFFNLIIDRLSTKKLLFIVLMMIFIQFSIYGFITNSVIITITTIFLKASSTMLFIMITLKATINTVPDYLINSALSIAATLKAIGGMLFQVFSGFIIDRFNIQILYVSFTFFTLLILIVLIFKFKLDEDAADTLFSGK
ncbi:MFS transporter [Staphylococcus equorum]